MRISFFGGPGSGKSTTAARIYSELKERNYSVEHVSEYVKSWTYTGKKPKGFDQVYIFGKQLEYEHRFLSNGVKNIITDSPTFLSGFYAKKYNGLNMAIPIWNLCKIYDSEYPTFNIFLERGDKPYHQDGRYQTEEEARQFDSDMYSDLCNFYKTKQTVKIPYNDKEAILAQVLEVCDK